MTTIIDLISFEEGYGANPYLCSEGYPTVGYGFKLGKKYQGLPGDFDDIYNFTLPQEVGKVWLDLKLRDLVNLMIRDKRLASAMDACFHASPEPWATNPRTAVLVSMAYQMGIEGLAKFKDTLGFVAAGRFADAATQMFRSKWARQTPNRAMRHADQMRTGRWAEEYKA